MGADGGEEGRAGRRGDAHGVTVRSGAGRPLGTGQVYKGRQAAGLGTCKGKRMACIVVIWLIDIIYILI